MSNPFGHLQDDQQLTPHVARSQLLDSVRRGFVPLRNVFVQLPRSSPVRGALLGDMVTARQGRALDALLLLHALWPVIDGDPLPIATWANLLSPAHGQCSASSASKAFGVLSDFNLVDRRREGKRSVVTPLLEDGSGKVWSRPRDHFFVIPHAYWKGGLFDRLHLPGKAMLLIMLKETQGIPSFEMAVERASAWYAISERTAERGYRELSDSGLLLTHIQYGVSPRLPPGVRRRRFHRALREPFSSDSRTRLQLHATTGAKAAYGGAEESGRRLN
ncbi:hypothetical protein E143388_07422 [Rhodococcus opacus]|nr:hypothetical protein E143388_07422 [Rhodococcus opacus]